MTNNSKFSLETEDFLVQKVAELSNIYAESTGMSPEDYYLYSTVFLMNHFELDEEKEQLNEAFERSGSLTRDAVVVELSSIRASDETEMYHLDPSILADKKRLDAVFNAQRNLVKQSPILPPKEHLGGGEAWHLRVLGKKQVLSFS
ncbi:MAG: hypothetical protein AAF244_03630 [Pseudomonadota bacterium]